MKKHSGFTLVELIITIAIMAVLTGILVPQFLTYVDRAHAQVCKTSRNELERQVSTTIAGDVDGSFREFLDTNYGITNPDDINKSGSDISLLLEQLNISSDSEICKADGLITANYYQTDDTNTFIFKIVCSEHDDIGAIPIIDFSSGYEKNSMQTMGSVILDMFDYYVTDKYEDKNWKVEFYNNSVTASDGSDYYKFKKFNGGWQDGGSYAYTSDIDDFIQETVNENQSTSTLTRGSGANDTMIYFNNNNKDLN